MQHRIHIIAWLFAIWMLCGIPLTNVEAQVSKPAAWRTTPTLSSDITPGYQFRSTSTYAPVVGTTSYTSTTVYAPGAASVHPNRSKLWDDTEEENPVGQVDDPAPVGEPFVLLLLAGLFVIYKKRRTA